MNIKYRSRNIELKKGEREDISKEQAAAHRMRLFRFFEYRISNIEYQSRNIEFKKCERGDISKEQAAAHRMRLFRFFEYRISI